jgi:hypothetical protein
MLSCTAEQTLVLSEGSGDASMGWTQLVSNYNYLHLFIQVMKDQHLHVAIM